MQIDLKGQVAFVTGGGSGLGRAASIALARAGARVAVSDIDEKATQTVAESIRSEGSEALSAPADAADSSGVERAIGKTRESFGKVDIVHTCHGIVRPALFHKMTDDDWHRVIDVHLNGTYYVVRAVIDEMIARGYGRIITVTSPAGVQGSFGQASYAAAKGGIISLTKSLAREYAKKGITANAINPVAATPMTEKVRTDPKLEQVFLKKIPMERWAEPEEIVPVVVFLASSLASYVTGQVYGVNGGLTM